MVSIVDPALLSRLEAELCDAQNAGEAQAVVGRMAAKNYQLQAWLNQAVSPVSQRAIMRRLDGQDHLHGRPYIHGEDPLYDQALRDLIAAMTGANSKTIGVSPIQNGCIAVSAGHLLVIQETGEIILGAVNEEPKGKLIPENGMYRLASGFHTEHGYFRIKQDCADAKLKQFLGTTVEQLDGVSLGGPDMIMTEYPYGGLANVLECNRWAFTVVTYIPEAAVDRIVIPKDKDGKPVLKGLRRMGHEEFMAEVAKIKAGEPNMLSRFPQQALDYADRFPDNFFVRRVGQPELDLSVDIRPYLQSLGRQVDAGSARSL